MDAMPLCEAIYKITSVFSYSLKQIVGHTDVEGAIPTAGKNIDKVR